MPKKAIGRVIFKDGHTEPIVDYRAKPGDDWAAVCTPWANKYVYRKTSNHECYYKLVSDKYEQPDYILVNDIEKFEIYNT